MNAMEIARIAARTLDTHKAEDLVALDVADVTSLADVFLFATGGSTTQVRALADYVEEELKKEGVTPARTDGLAGAAWIVQDYGDVILHVMTRQTRDFYGLERLWQDAAVIPLTELMKEGK